MKILKFFGFLIVVAVVCFFASPLVSPVVGVKNLTPVHSFGSSLKLSITMTNYTPRAKEIYFNQGDGAEIITLYVDSAVPPQPAKVKKEDGLTTMTIPSFGHHTISPSFTLHESSTKTGPQIVPSNFAELTLSPGTHRFIVSWGGYLSDQQTITVE